MRVHNHRGCVTRRCALCKFEKRKRKRARTLNCLINLRVTAAREGGVGALLKNYNIAQKGPRKIGLPHIFEDFFRPSRCVPHCTCLRLLDSPRIARGITSELVFRFVILFRSLFQHNHSITVCECE